jgi:hypothetical protein
MRNSMTLARTVIVRATTMLAPDAPDRDASDVDEERRQRRRVEVEEIRRQLGDDDLRSHGPSV